MAVSDIVRRHISKVVRMSGSSYQHRCARLAITPFVLTSCSDALRDRRKGYSLFRLISLPSTGFPDGLSPPSEQCVPTPSLQFS